MRYNIIIIVNNSNSWVWGNFFYRYFLKCCIYLAEFEILNIPYTFESFHKSPKEGMIKGLWKNHSHEPTVWLLIPL